MRLTSATVAERAHAYRESRPPAADAFQPPAGVRDAESIAEGVSPPEVSTPAEGLEFLLSLDRQTLTTLSRDIAIVSRVRCPGTGTAVRLSGIRIQPAN